MTRYLKNGDLVEFVNKTLNVFYKGVVVRPCETSPYYEIEIITTSRTNSSGAIMIAEIGQILKVSTNESTANPYVFTNIKGFEEQLAEYEAHKNLELCHLAVNLNNRDWFEECHARYALWNSKVVQA